MRFATNTTKLDPDQVREETLNGQEYLVAPVVAVREMVLNGGFLRFEEIQQSVPGWNGRPVTLTHPTDTEGNFVSANAPEVHDKTVYGRLFNAEADADNRSLVGEVWLHVGLARAMGGDAQETLKMLQSGDPLEVSTGYFMEPEPENGTHNGDRYEQVQTNVMPDHLATLPGQEGACSVEDGCGAPRLNAAQTTPTSQARASPRTPEFSDTSAGGDWSSVDLTFGAFASAYADGDPSSVNDLTEDERSRIAARSMNGDPDADSFSELVVLPVVNPSSDNLSEAGLRAALSRAPSTDGINVEETQSRIRSLLEEHFDADFSEAEENAMKTLRHGVHVLTGQDCDCGDGQATTDTQETDMNDDLKEVLHDATGVELEDLDDPDDDTVEALQAELAEADDQGDDDTAQANDGGADGDEEYLTRDELEEALAAHRTEEQRDEYVTYITDNSDEYEADDLAETPLSVLKTLASDVASEAQSGVGSVAGGVNYAGRGASEPSANSNEWEDYDVPTTVNHGGEADD